MYEIYATETFKKNHESLDKSEIIWMSKVKQKLKDNPSGKPLGFDWFREKKYLNKRLYFLIDHKTEKILLISFASKKEQQDIIAFVKNNKEELLSLLKKI